jgi:hypothetical protein
MAFMKNVIILNLKSIFLPDHILQSDRNNSFVEKSLEKRLDNPPYFDPVAVKEIQRMIDETKAEIVISDNWFWTKDFDITEQWCKNNGLRLKFHKDFITPKKMSSLRINEIQWWIGNNPDSQVILILDENYSMRNLVDNAKDEIREYENYLMEYKDCLGEKRRKSLIPMLTYMRYENFQPFYGVEAERTVCIKEDTGLTPEVIEKAWDIIKKATT